MSKKLKGVLEELEKTEKELKAAKQEHEAAVEARHILDTKYVDRLTETKDVYIKVSYSLLMCFCVSHFCTVNNTIG